MNKENDKAGCFLIIEAKVENENFLLYNLYDANTESEQLSTLYDLINMLEKINDDADKNVVLGGDFNLFFLAKLEDRGGKPVLKKKIFIKNNRS